MFEKLVQAVIITVALSLISGLHTASNTPNAATVSEAPSPSAISFKF